MLSNLTLYVYSISKINLLNSSFRPRIETMSKISLFVGFKSILTKVTIDCTRFLQGMLSRTLVMHYVYMVAGCIYFSHVSVFFSLNLFYVSPPFMTSFTTLFSRFVFFYIFRKKRQILKCWRFLRLVGSIEWNLLIPSQT